MTFILGTLFGVLLMVAYLTFGVVRSFHDSHSGWIFRVVDGYFDAREAYLRVRDKLRDARGTDEDDGPTGSAPVTPVPGAPGR